MLGYMTAKEAKNQGFTHHGKYYEIPLWVKFEGDDLHVEVKWCPMNYVMTLFHYIEGFLNFIMGNEPSFLFQIGEKIDEN